MKKTLLTNLTLIIFGVVVAIGASYAHAAWGGPLTNTFSGPTAAPYGNNASTPVNVGVTDQVKAGSLVLGEWFIALANAQVDGTTFFTGGLRGGAAGTTIGTVRFGGPNVEVPTHVAISGGLANTNYTVQSNPLANPTDNAVCADETGTLVLCEPAVWEEELPAPVGNGTVQFTVNSNQSGSYVTVQSNNDGQFYTISTSPTTVPYGSYAITETNVFCMDTGNPVQLSGNATDFAISQNSTSFTITFNSC